MKIIKSRKAFTCELRRAQQVRGTDKGDLLLDPDWIEVNQLEEE